MADLQDHAISARVATDAGKLLLDIRERLFSQGADSWTVKDTGDLEAHRFIMKALQQEFPDDGILSEEGSDGLPRLALALAPLICARSKRHASVLVCFFDGRRARARSAKPGVF